MSVIRGTAIVDRIVSRKTRVVGTSGAGRSPGRRPTTHVAPKPKGPQNTRNGHNEEVSPTQGKGKEIVLGRTSGGGG